VITIVLCGVSGVGKTTIAKELEKQGFQRTITYTTRPMRPGEMDGVDYHFISLDEFKKRIEDNFFLEYAENFGNFYASSLNQNANSVMCLSIEGFLVARKLAKIAGFYLLPPAQDELISRISIRDDGQLESRLADIYKIAEDEKEHFEHILEPNTIEETIKQILNHLK
jgi:guanylate kinase